jgi:hypothetical protein
MSNKQTLAKLHNAGKKITCLKQKLRCNKAKAFIGASLITGVLFTGLGILKNNNTQLINNLEKIDQIVNQDTTWYALHSYYSGYSVLSRVDENISDNMPNYIIEMYEDRKSAQYSLIRDKLEEKNPDKVYDFSNATFYKNNSSDYKSYNIPELKNYALPLDVRTIELETPNWFKLLCMACGFGYAAIVFWYFKNSDYYEALVKTLSIYNQELETLSLEAYNTVEMELLHSVFPAITCKNPDETSPHFVDFEYEYNRYIQLRETLIEQNENNQKKLIEE